MVFGFLPLVILAAIPTTNVKLLSVQVELPVRFFKIKRSFRSISNVYNAVVLKLWWEGGSTDRA